MNPIEAVIHTERDVLDKLEQRWEQLQKGSLDITVFQQYGWLKNSWEFISSLEHATPYVVEITEDNQTIGIVPMYCTIEKFVNLTIRTLKPIGAGHSDYMMPIFSAKYEPNELMEIALEAIFKDTANWDCINWKDVPMNSTIDYIFSKQFKLWTPFIERKQTAVCPYVNLQHGMEAVQHNISKRLLKEVLYKERRLKRKGILQYRKVNTKKEIVSIMNRFFTLHYQRWKNTDTPSQFNDPIARTRVLQAALELFDQQLLYLSYISLDDAITAVHFGMKDRRRNYLYLHAVNQEYRKYSVGSLLVYYIIQDSFLEGLETVDFLKGNESFKKRWGAVNRFNVQYIAYNKTMHSRLSKKIHMAYYSDDFLQQSKQKQFFTKLGIRLSVYVLRVLRYFKSSSHMHESISSSTNS